MKKNNKTENNLSNNKDIEVETNSFSLEEQIRRMLIYSRNELKLTQKQLAEKSGIRQSNISRIECGSCTPTLETIKALADAMGKQVQIKLI
ncbi:MAG: helix-turn-helix transcriptional regulator [Lachnospiraceae bacterium]|nr:helix-turn-helix transcriptional regulator [Lachnospiraceae bacterium]